MRPWSARSVWFQRTKLNVIVRIGNEYLSHLGVKNVVTSRRDFLKTASAAAFAAEAAHPFLSWAADQAAIPIPGKDGMIVRSYRFLDLEMPVEFMTDWITPVRHFYVRNHMFPPAKLDARTWKLTISGEVEKPLTLTLADLKRIPVHSIVNTLECAGNGRSLQIPTVPGVQWGKGAVGNAKFSGPTLKALLEKAGVKDIGKHVQFRGLDQVPGKVPPFIRSIPIEKALDGGTIVATHMNGATLGAHHGFPRARRNARLGRRGVLQMAFGDHCPRQAGRGKLHEPGLPFS